MNKTVKFILGSIAVVAAFVSTALPTTDVLRAAASDRRYPVYGFIFFLASVITATRLKKPIPYAIVFTVCAAADFLLDRKSIFILAPIAALTWFLINRLENINSESEKRKKLLPVNVITICITLAFFAVSLIYLKRTEDYIGIKWAYYASWAAFLAYYAYSLVFKSELSFSKKIKAALRI